MALFGSLAALRTQAPQNARFAAAFAHAGELLRPGSPAQARLRGIPAGGSHRVELGDGVFAIEQVYETKPRAEGFFESHRKYIDLQVVVEGAEAMDVIDAAYIAVRDPYDVERDLVTYADTAEASRLRVGAGQAAIFSPSTCTCRRCAWPRSRCSCARSWSRFPSPEPRPAHRAG